MSLKNTSPDVGLYNPVKILINVVLPAPLLPVIKITSPFLIFKSTGPILNAALVLSYSNLTSLNVILLKMWSSLSE